MSASGTPAPSYLTVPYCRLTVIDLRVLQTVAHGCRMTTRWMRFLRKIGGTWPNEGQWPDRWNLIRRVLLTGILLTTCPTSAQVHQWNVDGSGSWNQPKNWSPLGEPNSSDAVAKLGNVITRPQTIFVDNDITVNRIEIDSEESYGLNGLNVFFDSLTDNASIEVDRGSHQFQTPVDLLRDLELDLAFGSTLSFNNALNLNGRTLLQTRAGELQINGSRGNTGVVAATRGVVSGSGNVGGDLSNVSAAVAPGPGFGRLSVSGNYTQGSAATLEIELGGATTDLRDVLDVAQSANLGGTLSIIVNGFVPGRGDQFGILSFSQRNGNFADIQGLVLGPTLRLVPQYGSNELTLTAAELDFWISGPGTWTERNHWQSGSVPDSNTVAVVDDGGLADVIMPTSAVAGLDILNGSINVDIEGSLIVNGTSRVGPDGTLSILASAATEPFTTQSLDIQGVLDVNRGGNATVSNELSVAPSGTVAIGPGSFMNVLGGLRNLDAATETLTGGAYDIGGLLVFSGAHVVTNQATLVLNGTGAMIGDLDGGNALNDLAGNAASSNLNLINHNLGVSGDFTNAGSFTIDNSSFNAAGTYVQTSGITQLNEGILAASSVQIQSGQLTGQGTVFGKLVNAAEAIPGLDGAGILQIRGDYIQTEAGRLVIEIGGLQVGTRHDQLNVAEGMAQLGGLLELRFTRGFQPAFGQRFLVIQGNVTSPFNSLRFPNSLQGLALDLIYGSNGMVVEFAWPTDETYESLSGGGLWSEASLWEQGVPSSLDMVNLTKTVPGNQTLTVDIDAFVHQATVRTQPELTGTLTLVVPDGQNWSATSDVTVGTNASIKVDGGNFQAGGNVTVDGAGSARFIQTGGNVNIGGNLELATVDGSGVYSLTGGTLDLNGGAILMGFGSPIFDFSGGRLTNVRRVSADDPKDAKLVQVAGTLAPGNSPGTIEIEGDYTIMNAGTLEIEVEGISPGEFDELLVGGNATLDGTLDIQLEETYDPSVGDMIAVLTASNISGEFSSVTTAMDDDTIMVPIYTGNMMFLCGSTIGDMDIDCDVDTNDIDEFVLALNDPIAYVLQEGFSGEDLGDFDNDNDLDFDDVDGFAAALGGGMSVQQILNWVPEPGGFVMWGIAWLLWCASRTSRLGRRGTTTNG